MRFDVVSATLAPSGKSYCPVCFLYGRSPDVEKWNGKATRSASDRKESMVANPHGECFSSRGNTIGDDTRQCALAFHLCSILDRSVLWLALYSRSLCVLDRSLF